MQQVISELFDLYRGKPILVIGGGPSVAQDIPALPADFRPALVLSANEHGCKQDRFTVDYIVHCDKVHCFRHEPMAPYLRQFGKPLISRWATADVRLEDWRFGGNSGSTAVAIAAALGGSPIVVTGLDFWATGRNYFWDMAASLPPAKRRAAARPIIQQPDRRLRALAQFVGGAHVRPLSGLLVTRWPKYRPKETLGEPPVIQYTAQARQSADYRALRSFHWSNYDTVAAGTVLRLTKAEAAELLRDGRVAPAVSTM